MRRLIIISLTALLLASCDGKTEVQKSKEIIDSYYDNPNLKKYYSAKTISIWHKVYEICGDDIDDLKSHQEFLMNKVLDAEYKNTLDEAGVKVD